jgi:hypothetical protein
MRKLLSILAASVATVVASPPPVHAEWVAPVADEAAIAKLPQALGSFEISRAKDSALVTYRPKDGSQAPLIRIFSGRFRENLSAQHVQALANERRVQESGKVVAFKFVRAPKFAGFAGIYCQFDDQSSKNMDGNGRRQMWLLISGKRLLDIQIVLSDAQQAPAIQKLVNDQLLGGVIG